jgi:hypothetical protein
MKTVVPLELSAHVSRDLIKHKQEDKSRAHGHTARGHTDKWAQRYAWTQGYMGTGHRDICIQGRMCTRDIDTRDTEKHGHIQIETHGHKNIPAQGQTDTQTYKLTDTQISVTYFYRNTWAHGHMNICPQRQMYTWTYRHTVLHVMYCTHEQTEIWTQGHICTQTYGHTDVKARGQ